MNKDLISDIEYLITALEQSADADDYWRPISDLRDDLLALKKREQPPMTQREMYQRGYAQAERDLNREPLSHDLINECVENSDSFGFNGDVYIADGDNAFENFARAIEKVHGIGETNE